MDSLPTVNVLGEAHLEVQPELAGVIVTATGRDADRHAAMTQLESARSVVTRLLTEHADVIEKVTGGWVRVSYELDADKPGKQIKACVATSEWRLSIQDFTALEGLFDALVAQDLLSIRGPSWGLRATSPVYRQARIDAVQDAISRVKDYADALGSQVVELISLADAGGAGRGATMTFSGGGQRGAPSPATPEFNFVPEPQTVVGHVQACFSISEVLIH